MSDTVIRCCKCKHNAIIFQKYSGMHLCPVHLVEDIERKIKKSIRKNFRIAKNDKIAVALSGGKDSTVTLFVLNKIFSERADITLKAITVDEGIKGYRKNTIKLAKSFTEKIDIEHTVVSFEESYGVTLDEIVKQKQDQKPCTFCGVLRRALLNNKAMELNCTKLATGHNLDDEAQTVLMNYLRGDIERLVRRVNVKEGFVPRIKPLIDIPEKEVALYAMINNLCLDDSECPYAKFALRQEIRDMINDYEINHPGSKYALMRGFEKISNSIKVGSYDLLGCEICGAPSGDRLCKSCNLLKQIKLV